MRNHEIAKHVCERLSEDGCCDFKITKKGYQIRFNSTPIAIVRNSCLYVRMTLQGRALLDRPVILPPYDGAVYHIRIKEIDQSEVWVPLLKETWNAIVGSK